MDNLAKSALARNLQFAASKVVIAKSLYRRGYLTDSGKKKLFMWLCTLLPKKPMLRFTQKRRKNDSEHVHSFFAAASKYSKNIFPRKWFTELTELEFEGRKFPVSKHYDEMLTRIYGNYMVIPPKKERGCKVHGEIVDLENSYEIYIEAQKQMRFTEYSRSIR